MPGHASAPQEALRADEVRQGEHGVTMPLSHPTTPLPEGGERNVAPAAVAAMQQPQPQDIPEPQRDMSPPVDAVAPAPVPNGGNTSPTTGELPVLPSVEEQPVPVSRAQFQKEQQSDPTLQAAWSLARGESHTTSPNDRSKFVVVGGLLYREFWPKDFREGWSPLRQLLVPAAYRAKLLSLAHDHPSGHSGITRTKDRLKKAFFWDGMNKDVAIFVRSCLVCQQVGNSKDQTKAPLQPLPIIEVPFQRVAVDILGPLPRKTARGKQYILTLVDFCTRWPEAVPLGAISAKAVAQALTDIFARVGWPLEILTDAGTNFMSKAVNRLWESHGVKHLTSVPYHHQTNGLVERFHSTLGTMIRKFVEEHSNDWDLALQQFLFAYRSVPHPSLGFSPFELVYGHEVKGPLQLVRRQWEGDQPSQQTNVVDFVTKLQNTLRSAWQEAHDNLRQAQQDQKAWYDQFARERCFQPGDHVMVLKASRTNKLETSWIGPATVLERMGPVNYLIQLPDTGLKPKVYHVNSLKPFHERPQYLLALEDPEAEDEEWPEGAFYDKREGGNLEDIQIPTRLDSNQRTEFSHLTSRFASLFSPIPGLTMDPQHVVAADDNRPSAEQPRRVSPVAKQAIEKEINEMLEMGIIRPSRSTWASPVVLVPKKGGKEIRFCVDYRRLNSVTRPEQYPMPRVDELLEKLGRAKYLSSIDLTKGYWQVALAEESKHRTAFITHMGLFEFNVLPFGLRNAPATFQRLVDSLLRGCGDFAVAYLDDIAIFSDSWEDHLKHLETVFQRIQEAGLTIKAKKCQFVLERVTYLGHEVGQGTITPLQAKVEVIQDWPRPKSRKQVQSFLGLSGYYRRFVPHYSQIAAPLTDLTGSKKPKIVKWTEGCQEAFDTLKRALTSDPVLMAPDFDKPFTIATDASDRGIGAVLMQEGPDGFLHPVLFLSKKLSARESNWSIPEKECYAIVYALDKLKPYVWGRQFTLQTDHAALRWLHSVQGANKKLLRWSVSLQDFDFEIQHVAGASNVVADCLSRRGLVGH
ncbi:uncharacterized protein LOC121929090 [Sceloporus undulatus]|uniref:uncharacterized protein LOC121929090 n=1 Tax=Sceloporus undulatus TaxID=8520 RepID=UPI001C4C04F4|nr:uncharacterized protein LOC121929090 [Sceloporus undulatus]